MASSQTTNYSLPQWSKSDRIQMSDFNSAMSTIDAALKSAHESVRIVHGTYVGNGAATRTVDLPFAPKLVILMGHIYDYGILAVLTPLATAYTSDSYAVVGAAGEGNYNPYLSGAAICIKNAAWCNQSGKTVYYTLIG